VKIVVALGGNALLERGEPPDSDIQESHVASAVGALTPLLRSHDLVITHGNGPQVGLLALESAGDPALSHPYPFDVECRPGGAPNRPDGFPGSGIIQRAGSQFAGPRTRPSERGR